MRYLLALLLTFSFSMFAASNSIIAIVNDNVITTDSISAKVNKKTTKKQKLALVEQQIDIELQKEKIQALNINPKPEIINTVLKNIAKQDNLTFEQLRANNQFDQIIETVTQNISLEGLKQIVLQQVNIGASQAEIDETLGNNPKKTYITEESHLANIKAQIVRTKQNSFFYNWVKNLRKGAYIEIFEYKLK